MVVTMAVLVRGVVAVLPMHMVMVVVPMVVVAVGPVGLVFLEEFGVDVELGR